MTERYKNSLICAALDGECLGYFEGMCGEIADAILHAADGRRQAILYVSPVDEHEALRTRYETDTNWSYHQVAVIDGLVVDPWNDAEPMEPGEYLLHVFPEQDVVGELFEETGG